MDKDKKLVNCLNTHYQQLFSNYFDNINILGDLEDMYLRKKRICNKINDENERTENYPVFVADFETITAETKYYQKYKKTGVLLWCMKELYNHEAEHQLGTNLDSFFKHLRTLNYSMYIYFHNLSFDGDFIIKYLAKNDFKIINRGFDKVERKAKQFEVFREGSKIYKIVVYFRNREANKVIDQKIVFLCSKHILSNSVATLAKNYGTTKLRDDENKDTFYIVEPQEQVTDYTPRFIEYIKNDVDIVRYALIDFEKAITNLQTSQEYVKYTNKPFKIYHYLTIASLSFALIKQRLFLDDKKLDEYLQINYSDYLFLKPFFSGGLTQFSKKYQGANKELNKCLFIDVNSAYPAVMSDYLPYGSLLDVKPKGVKVCEWLQIRINKLKIKPQYSNLVFAKDWSHKMKFKKEKYNGEEIITAYMPRYIKSLKNADAYYLREELETLKKIYDIDYVIVKRKYQKLDNYLSMHINNLFDLKAQYKANKDAKLLGIKILLNSGYGCLAKKLSYPVFYYSKEHLNKGDYVNEYLVKSANNSYNIGDYHCYSLTKENIDYNKVINIGAAAYITALQRVKLINKVLSVKNVNKKFVLSDTDSILFGNLTTDDYNNLSASLSNVLGEWSEEYKNLNDIPKVSIFGAKKYKIIENDEVIKSRFSGVNNKDFLNNVLVDEWNKSVLEVANAALSIERCEDGILLTQKTKLIKRGEL